LATSGCQRSARTPGGQGLRRASMARAGQRERGERERQRGVRVSGKWRRGERGRGGRERVETGSEGPMAAFASNWHGRVGAQPQSFEAIAKRGRAQIARVLAQRCVASGSDAPSKCACSAASRSLMAVRWSRWVHLPASLTASSLSSSDMSRNHVENSLY